MPGRTKALKRSSSSRQVRDRAPSSKSTVGLALAGGGPFGAVYEIGALIALEEALEGLDLNDCRVYVGVSAGSYIAAALANDIPIRETYRMFIADERTPRSLAPELLMRPAWGEYAKRLATLPPEFVRALFRYLRDPLRRRALEAFAPLWRAVPTGLFDNAPIEEYLRGLFTGHGHTNDFRKLKRKLFAIATDLDTGEPVSFGSPGLDHVPISRAVQASSALPGLFPPVSIDGRAYVDGALQRTLHATVALDHGADLLIAVNPIVTFNAERAARTEAPVKLEHGGLPAVLSQTFRALIHSRMRISFETYKTRYPGAEIVLFEPDTGDADVFNTNVFSYRARARVCDLAYRRTRHNLLERFEEYDALFRRHGLRLKRETLADPDRTLNLVVRSDDAPDSLHHAVHSLRSTLKSLGSIVDRPASARVRKLG